MSMDITVTGRRKSVKDGFRRHLEDKLAKVEQLAPSVTRADVVLSHEANPRQAKECERVEITCFVRRTVVRAEASADEEYAALDLAMAKLLERLRRLADKKRVAHQGRGRPPSVGEATAGLPTDPLGVSSEPEPEASADPLERVDADLGTAGNSPIELREKAHDTHPMTVGQAINQMELIGHDFFLFHDVDADCARVVYRRRGWSYGVIHLDVSAAEAAEAAGATESSAASSRSEAGQPAGVAAG